MDLRKWMLVPVLALSALVTGCGADCESLCEDAQECEGAEKTDCAKECEETEKLVESKGCEDQYDDFLSCASDVDDICKQDESACTAEAVAFGTCMGADG